MLTETIVRFVLGGVLVALFAVLGDVLEPKTFAGVFGAAPSVALATLAMAYAQHGASYAKIEGRSMLGGAFALAIYSRSVAAALDRGRASPWLVAMLLWLLWLGAAGIAWTLIGA